MKSLLSKFVFLIILIFALVGITLTGIFALTYFHVTDVSGKIDIASALFSNSKWQKKDGDTLGVSVSSDSAGLHQELTQKYQDICYINTIASFGSDNATKIYNSYLQTNSDSLLGNMVNAISIRLKNNSSYEDDMNQCINPNSTHLATVYNPQEEQVNLYPWVNDSETYNVLINAMTKDVAEINRAASLANIPARLLVAPLFVEQYREYTTQRELFKKLFEPLQTLATSTNFSLGVMNIKEDTATEIEKHLKDPNSPYYLGPDYEHLLDFTTENPTQERFNRLANYKDHSYSYLYGSLYLAQLMHQWRTLGYQIDDRPEIVATLFNIGFSHSKPNPNPSVGGAEIKINGTQYTFGGLAYEFYYSGELTNLFPYSK